MKNLKDAAKSILMQRACLITRFLHDQVCHFLSSLSIYLCVAQCTSTACIMTPLLLPFVLIALLLRNSKGVSMYCSPLIP